MKTGCASITGNGEESMVVGVPMSPEVLAARKNGRCGFSARMSQQVSKRLGSLGYNPHKAIYKQVI